MSGQGASLAGWRNGIVPRATDAFHPSAKHAKISGCGGTGADGLLEDLEFRYTYLRESMKAYMCVICGFIYDEEKGIPEQGITAGTCWKDLPENWKCPDCGASKDEFEMIEI